MNLTYLVLTKIGILSAVIFGYSKANAELSNEQKRLQAASAPTCGNFRNILESYLAGLPKDCKENSDCKAQFLHIDSCAAGYLFNKKIVNSLSFWSRLLANGSSMS